MSAPIRLLVKFAIVFVLFVVAPVNSQQIWKAETPYGWAYGASPDAACEIAVSSVTGQPGWAFIGTQASIQSCQLSLGGTVFNTGYYFLITTCPAGKVPDYKTGECKDSCPANGTLGSVRNYTVAWSRNPDGSDIAVPPLDLNPKACVDSCEVQASTITKTDWISKNPASNGLYRISADVSTSYTGKTCAPTAPDYNSSNPGGSIPPCPGTYGEINGKPVCLGNSPSNDKKPKNYGNPRAGSSPTDSAQTREPSPSNGGNAGPGGGPDVTGGGTSGTNTGGGPVGGSDQGGGADPDAPPDDEPQKSQCELTPNAAFCKEKVPIDETGTPNSNGTYDSATSILDTVRDGFSGLFGSASDSSGKDTSPGSLFPSWAHASCLPFNLGTLPGLNTSLTFNICPILDPVTDFVSFCWVIITALMCGGMVFRTVQGGA